MFSFREHKLIKPIYELNEGEKGKIVQIHAKTVEERFLNIIGFDIGCDISIDKVITTSRERIITINNGAIELTLDKTLCHNIEVEIPVAS
jgi:Fe2+ transport system protein FeoA